jgi:hypothetical protein
LAGVINIFDEKINITKKNKKILLEASREVGPEVNTEKTNYMVTARHHNSGKYHTLLVANKCNVNVAKLKGLVRK